MRGGIAALLLALGLLGGLSGCADDDPTTASFEDDMAEAAPDDEPDVKELAREALKGQDPAQFGLMSDESLDRIFEISCTGFDDGLTGEQVAIAGMPTFGDAIGAVMMGAAMGYCPEHRIKVDVWMEQYS